MKKLSQGPVRRPTGLNSPATRSSAGFIMREIQTGLHKPEGGTKQYLTKSTDNSAPVCFPNCASICLGSRVSFDLPLALGTLAARTLARGPRRRVFQGQSRSTNINGRVTRVRHLKSRGAIQITDAACPSKGFFPCSFSLDAASCNRLP